MPSHGSAVFCRRCVSPARRLRGRRSAPPACVPFRRRDPLPREFLARERAFLCSKPNTRLRKKFCGRRVFFCAENRLRRSFCIPFCEFCAEAKAFGARGEKIFVFFFSSVRKRGECGVHIRVTGGRKAPQTNENPGGEKNVKKAERKIREKAPSGCPLRHKKEKEK